MFKVLLAAYLFLGGALVEPPLALGVPDVEFASAEECEAKTSTDEFKQIIEKLFQDFLADKVQPGVPIAVVKQCMSAEKADAAVAPPGESI